MTSASRGQAFLALVLLVGVLIIMTGGTLIFLVSTFVDTSYGSRAVAQARSLAIGGVEDALMQLDRNSTFASGGYTVTVASSTATVTVTQNSPVANEDTILSIATVSGRTRTLNVVVSENALIGEINRVSWANLP